MIYVDPDDLKLICLLQGSGSQFESEFPETGTVYSGPCGSRDGDAVVLASALFPGRRKGRIWDPGSGKHACGREKETGKKIFSGKTLERKKIYEAERKWSGIWDRDRRRAAATSGRKQNGSEGKVQIF